MLGGAWAPIALLAGFLLTVRMVFGRDLHSISPRAAQALTQPGGVTILDIREAREVLGSSLPGARFIPLSQLARRMSEIPQGQILVYCASGQRGRSAVAWLRRAGHLDAWNLEGGLNAWAQQGYPLQG